MYRDASEHVDEHDRGAATLLLAEALLHTCDGAARTVADELAPPPDRWRAVRQLHDTFPDMWKSLDRARALLARRGANTVAYDELAPGARRSAVVSRIHGIDRSVAIDGSFVDGAALADGHRALERLRLAMPGADWSAIEARTRGLASADMRIHRRPRMLASLAAVAGIVVVGLMWPASSRAHAPRASKTVPLQQQLTDIKQQRHEQIEALRTEVASVCDPSKARTYTQLLVMDGKRMSASDFASDYTGRCGEDEVVEHWANAPMPPSLKEGTALYPVDFDAVSTGLLRAKPTPSNR